MFDDFMHNALPDMHLHQPHQNAMLHAQGQAMQQAAQQASGDKIQTDPPIDPPQPTPFTELHNAATNIGLIIQATLEKVLRIQKAALTNTHN